MGNKQLLIEDWPEPLQYQMEEMSHSMNFKQTINLNTQQFLYYLIRQITM